MVARHTLDTRRRTNDDTRGSSRANPLQFTLDSFPAKVRPDGMGKRYSVGRERVLYGGCVVFDPVGDLDESREQ